MDKKKINKKIDTEEEVVHNDDIHFEEEGESAADTLRKLRKKLKECQKERAEYLDGWQRIQAEVVNARKAEVLAKEKERERIVQDVLLSFLPALDAFDMAINSEAWHSVDGAWRAGVEHIHSLLTTTLALYNVAPYGEVGDKFDTSLHEALSSQSVPSEQENTVVSVLKKGYVMGESVLRPAQVIIGVSK
ncbi:nucleotide exchange factor GrpE [Candidatus Kaiserbacteria bacterium CG10_big_fil_rev_8_21_14_0_10_49_17]|uniref:Protein GrpE n=1 Tax=Candidatus Kaiserbacteria bacterium CG10_big_fil_rev_8_21_14_0_10_49_17 TaxID=1974609 RepID=A0A2M6WF36_9BACT|nr:MAG: nucleotide exchange factor GrpE [Candidatus Kaiserbacteria bacterium CG10_big_fil_rev_8_21_14_0_10_49_17]